MTRFVVAAGFTHKGEKESKAVESLLATAIKAAGITLPENHEVGTSFKVESSSITLASRLREAIIAQLDGSEVKKKHTNIAGFNLLVESLKNGLSVNQAQ